VQRDGPVRRHPRIPNLTAGEGTIRRRRTALQHHTFEGFCSLIDRAILRDLLRRRRVVAVGVVEIVKLLLCQRCHASPIRLLAA